MKHVSRLGLAAILLAGTSLAGPAVFAQESQPSTEILQPNSAKDNAPGQTKGDGTSAAEKAPGQMQNSGDVNAAKEAAPGQVKNDTAGTTPDKPLTTGEDDTAGKSDRPTKTTNDNSAEELAPGQTKTDGQSASDGAPGQMQNSGEVNSAKEAAPGQAKQDQAADGKTSDETTASVNITTEQTTEIREIIRETDVKPVTVDIDLRVGIEAPRTVEVHPLPPRFVEIVPAYRGYEYFVLVDGRIVIVEPSTYRVVYILTV